MDVTQHIMDLAVALLSVLVPVIVAYVATYAKKALAAIEVEKYASALNEYDVALYEAIRKAGEAAVVKALDEAQLFDETQLRPYLYSQASYVSEAFSEKAGVKVDLSEERVDALIEIAVKEAKEAIREGKSR